MTSSCREWNSEILASRCVVMMIEESLNYPPAWTTLAAVTLIWKSIGKATDSQPSLNAHSSNTAIRSLWHRIKATALYVYLMDWIGPTWSSMSILLPKIQIHFPDFSCLHWCHQWMTCCGWWVLTVCKKRLFEVLTKSGCIANVSKSNHCNQWRNCGLITLLNKIKWVTSNIVTSSCFVGCFKIRNFQPD